MDSTFFGLNEFAIYKNNNTETLSSKYEYEFTFPFEKIEDTKALTLMFQKYWYHSITVSVLYFVAIKALQKIMENRKPFELKYPLFLWNLALAIFSILGTVRFSEDFLHNWFNHGFTYSICHSCNPESVAAFWSLAFCASKVVELGDTLFIILKKKPLIFLHYYHHAAVLIYTVHSGAEHTSSGQAYILMNFFVHSLMYFYLALQTLRLFKMPKYVSMTLTTLQLIQMVIGVSTTLYVYYIKTKLGVPCQQSIPNIYFAIAIYLSFGILFVNFFINAYCVKQRKSKMQ
uniref:Elongation of very long chain fatty acids protein n=1 Tax=Rhabditophanes sp. KR3021 TaxID=114890 RepID=A0AC35TI83_9BILA